MARDQPCPMSIILLYHDKKTQVTKLPWVSYNYSIYIQRISFHRHRQRMIIVLLHVVLYHNWLTFNAGHLYWNLILLCDSPLYKWYSWNRPKGANVTWVLLSWYGIYNRCLKTDTRANFMHLNTIEVYCTNRLYVHDLSDV